MFHIVLVEPEIPPNTGNVARLCAATGAKLHLVGPLGFKINDSTLKRAGMDYWHLVDWKMWNSWDDFFDVTKEKNFYLLSSKAKKTIYETKFTEDDYLIFGRESKGLPETLLNQYPERTLTIPMQNPEARCLNLSTSTGIVLYEAIRQTTYNNLFYSKFA